MIIAINGYIGSGKDTVGQIIQYLTGDVKQMPFESYQKWASTRAKEAWSGWEIKKFAGKLKQIASIMLGVPVEKFEDQKFKKTVLGPEWGQNLLTLGYEPKTTFQPMTVREFLQRLGTEAIRNGLHENAWVNALFADYKNKWLQLNQGRETHEEVPGEEYPNWIITDMRFPNEMQAVNDRGGITIRVNRWPTDDEGNPFTQEQFDAWRKTLHPSETALDGAEFDHVIYNNGTIEELAAEVKTRLIMSGILKGMIS